jgi:chitosanase
MYFNPSVALATSDRLRALGQFAYYDAAVMHGMSGLRSVRNAALKVAKTPKQGGDETVWLAAFLTRGSRRCRRGGAQRHHRASTRRSASSSRTATST